MRLRLLIEFICYGKPQGVILLPVDICNGVASSCDRGFILPDELVDFVLESYR